MKYILILIMFMSLNVFGQDVYQIDTLGIMSVCDTCKMIWIYGDKSMTTFMSTENDSEGVSMNIIDCDTTISISGDTLKAIKGLFKWWNNSIEENKRLRDLLNEAEELLFRKFYGVEAVLPEKIKI